MKKLAIIFLIVLPVLGFGQKRSLLQNFGIDIGIGCNTYLEEYAYIPPEGAVSITRFGDTIPIPTFRHKGMASSVTYRPSIRLHYSLPIIKIAEGAKLQLPFFVGYYTFGGGVSLIYQNRQHRINKGSYNFHSLEMGLNPGVSFGRWYVGALVKGQYILAANLKIYHGIGNIEKMDITGNYQTYATSVGLNANYKIGRVSLGIESWFGLKNLYSTAFLESRAPWTYSLKDINFRAVVGFRFK